MASDVPQDRRVYAFGAYGTNNTGDEAIFAGLLREYPRAVQVYVNKKSKFDGVWYADVFERKIELEPNSLGIIGGGGLLHGEGAINDYIKFADAISDQGGSVQIRAIGAEAATPPLHDAIRALARRCERVTVRTKESQRIMREILGRDVDLEPDFAFRLRPKERRVSTRFPKSSHRPVVGVVTGMTPFVSKGEYLLRLIRAHSVGPQAFNFLLIPHSKAYVDPQNNDLLTYEYIWSSISIYHAEREDIIKIAEFSADPEHLLSIYAELDGVVGERFHSLIFSHIYNLPTLALGGSLKTKSLVADYPRDLLFYADSPEAETSLPPTFFSAVEKRFATRKG